MATRAMRIDPQRSLSPDPRADIGDPDAPVQPDDVEELSENEIAMRSYELWQERGSPVGSPEVDWFRAEQEIAAPKRTGEEQIATAEETPSTAPRLPVRSEVAEKVQRASGKA